MISASEILDGVRPGMNVPALRALRCSVSEVLAGEPARFVLELSRELAAASRIGRFLASEIVAEHEAAMAAIRLADVEALGRGMGSWEEVDVLCCSVTGIAWRTGRLRDADIRRWAASPDLWWRRAALVSTVPLNLKARGGTGDAARTLDICERLVDDRQDMVVKALSWALRALAVREPGVVREWLREHETALAPRVKREVLHKLDTGVKTPARRSSRRAD